MKSPNGACGLTSALPSAAYGSIESAKLNPTMLADE